MEETKQELTFGQQLCGITFNPSRNPDVDNIKSAMAELADMVNGMSKQGDSYAKNLIKGECLRSILTTQMYIVKLLTFEY